MTAPTSSSENPVKEELDFEEISGILFWDFIPGFAFSLFVFAEHTEPVTSEAIGRLSGHSYLDIAMTPPHTVTVMIKELLSPEKIPSGWPSIIISNRLCVKGITYLVVQFDNFHTAQIPFHIFDNLVKNHQHWIGEASTATIVRNLPSVLQQKATENWKEEIARRIKDLEDMTLFYSDIQRLKNDSETFKYGYVSEILKKQSEELNDIRQRIGPLHESVVRLQLEAARGPEWGKSKTIFGLYDIQEESKGQIVHTSYKVTSGFKTWNYNPENLKLTDIEFDDLNPYSKLHFWLDAAEATKGYKETERCLVIASDTRHDHIAIPELSLRFILFLASNAPSRSRTLRLIGCSAAGCSAIGCSAIGRAQNFNMPVKEKKMRIHNALLNDDQDVALAIFFLIMDTEAYKPDFTKDLSDWKTIPTKLEFGHKGKFEKVVETFWKYEGAESKSSIAAVGDARDQLTRRFALIDAIARIGYNATVIFSGKIYVPYIGKGQTTLYESPGMPESWVSSAPTEDDSTAEDTVVRSINPPTGLKGYTVIEVLTSAIELRES